MKILPSPDDYIAAWTDWRARLVAAGREEVRDLGWPEAFAVLTEAEFAHLHRLAQATHVLHAGVERVQIGYSDQKAPRP